MPLPDGAIDLAVNTASFGEMLRRRIASYFTGAGDARVAVRFEDYPWLPGHLDIFYGLSEFHRVIQPENPFMQRLCRLARA